MILNRVKSGLDWLSVQQNLFDILISLNIIADSYILLWMENINKYKILWKILYMSSCNAKLVRKIIESVYYAYWWH